MALFNRALLLQRLELRDEAGQIAFRAATASVGTPWQQEALDLVAVRRTNDDSRTWDRERPRLESAALANDDRRVQDIVTRFPEQARKWGVSIYPTQWADDVLLGSDAASRDLSTARTIGRVLQTINQDSLVADAVHSIDDSKDRATTYEIAGAYLIYRDGRMALSKDRTSDAERLLRDAEAQFRTLRSPMVLAASYYRGVATHASGQTAAAEEILRPVREELKRRGYRSLNAETGWELGLCLLERGDISGAETVFAESRDTFDLLGERQMRASMDGLLANAAEVAGDPEQAWRYRVKALAVQTIPRRRIGMLAVAINGCIQRHEWTRASALLNLTVDAAEHDRDAIEVVTALLQRSTVLAYEHDAAGARHDLAEIARWRRSPEVISIASRMQAGADFVEGLLERTDRANVAIAAFGRAASYYAHHHLEIYAPAAYLERARVERRVGRIGNSALDVNAGLAVAEQIRTSVRDVQQRAMNLATMNELFDEGLTIAYERNTKNEAFELAEHARARSILESFSGDGDAPNALPLSIDAIRSAMAPDSAIIEYASLDEFTIAFVVTPSLFEMARLPVTRDDIRTLSAATGRGAMSDPFERAHKMLIQPLTAWLTGVHQLAIVPDGNLFALPFASLGTANG
ncbi:MAG TPA: hypothetical protein VNN25_04485, partial [Thermoanaerobaculia bacterium]|nr:hypothetical protein [Thermoanaerobaculia bacterium]